MSAHVEKPIPKPVLWGIAAMVAAVFALTGAVALGLLDRPKPASQVRAEAGVPVVAERLLVFRDLPDGTLGIFEGAASAPFASVAAGSNEGFVRGVIRSMARERRMKGVGPEAPYRLRLWGDGRLSLEDVATGRTVELDSFGADNRRAFWRLLPGAAELAGKGA
ncbi:photosynthetic complex assembly protein PuhC [Thermaurantiacus tibetensis]|uniref:photosynthetic complex assembly protein PuhC n=1 Tax=Thermaurantiacus tibetensis TaxID=2759035 RepID=UPI0018904B8D|nr:photosynthetic complex assembly protein PuhC [Thermaurantiacus tibetensis]